VVGTTSHAIPAEKADFFYGVFMSKDIVLQSDLEVLAKAKGLVDTMGRPNVARMLALQADSNLKTTVSRRSDLKTQSGHKSNPGGLMIQINKRIKKGLGFSVQEMEKDQKKQTLVAYIRTACEMELSGYEINWTDDDCEIKDEKQKKAVYEVIDRMTKAWKAGGVS
jgi:hypothetical protein